MKKAAWSLRAHRELILNYFRDRKEFSSGEVEVLNNEVKVTMRKSYGFWTFRVTELALYHSPGKLPLPEITHGCFRRIKKVDQEEEPRYVILPASLSEVSGGRRSDNKPDSKTDGKSDTKTESTPVTITATKDSATK